MENIGYYILILVALIIAFLVIKKVTSCMVKAVVGIVVLALLAYIYYMYLR
jgi:hypothetical protein